MLLCLKAFQITQFCTVAAESSLKDHCRLSAAVILAPLDLQAKIASQEARIRFTTLAAPATAVPSFLILRRCLFCPVPLITKQNLNAE